MAAVLSGRLAATSPAGDACRTPAVPCSVAFVEATRDWKPAARFGLLAPLLLASGGASAQRVAVFPGPVHSASAPDRSGARIFYRRRDGSDDGGDIPVLYDDGRGRLVRVAAVTRDLGVGWLPDGRRAFLQDNYASNQADCHVLSRRARGVARVDLFDVVQLTPGHPAGAERPDDSHYYVHCDRWRGSGHITGAVSGHTDTDPAHGFDHPFTYDVLRRRLTWRRSAAAPRLGKQVPRSRPG